MADPVDGTEGEGHPDGVPLSRSTADEDQLSVLAEGQRLGFVGPAPLLEQVQHSMGFARLARRALERRWGRMADLGSGGGLPGLVTARALDEVGMVLLEASARRCRFLERAVERLGLRNAEVAHVRAEVAARGGLREQFAVVTSRSFGSPATTAECARGLMVAGGSLIVSEPPGGGPRWDESVLEELRLQPAESVSVDGRAYVVLRATDGCPQGVPRRNGVPAKRPLW